MYLFQSASSRQTNAALLILRVIAGFTIAMHGWQKVFVYGVNGVASGFAGMGIPMPSVLGPFVAYLEFAGGIAIVFGLLTRPVAIALVIDMLVAAIKVHLPNGFFMPKGAELTLLLAGVYSAFAVAGAGAFSLDALLNNRIAPPVLLAGRA